MYVVDAQKPIPAVLKRMSKVSSLWVCASALATIVTVSPARAGDFTLDWSTLNWPIGARGPLVYTLEDQYGFEINTTVTASGALANGPAGATPYVDTIFGGNVNSLLFVGDPGLGADRVGDDTLSTTIAFSSGATPIPVSGLTIDVLDVDASDNNNTGDRCDLVTFEGNNGNPTLAAISATPSFIAGPGSGLTGLLQSNQAQCIYVEGSGASPTSNNDDTGTVRATYPDDITSTTIRHDESIGNVRGFVFGADPAARGVGILANTSFNTFQTISLAREISAPSVYAPIRNHSSRVHATSGTAIMYTGGCV